MIATGERRDWRGEEMKLEILFKLDFVTVLPQPCVKHILRIVSVYLYVTALSSQMSM